MDHSGIHPNLEYVFVETEDRDAGLINWRPHSYGGWRLCLSVCVNA